MTCLYRQPPFVFRGGFFVCLPVANRHLYHQFFNSGFNESQISGRTREAFEISVLKCLSFRDNRKNPTEEIKDDLKKKPEDQSIEHSEKSKSKIPQKAEENIEIEEPKQINEENKLKKKFYTFRWVGLIFEKKKMESLNNLEKLIKEISLKKI